MLNRGVGNLREGGRPSRGAELDLYEVGWGSVGFRVISIFQAPRWKSLKKEIEHVLAVGLQKKVFKSFEFFKGIYGEKRVLKYL